MLVGWLVVTKQKSNSNLPFQWLTLDLLDRSSNLLPISCQCGQMVTSRLNTQKTA